MRKRGTFVASLGLALLAFVRSPDVLPLTKSPVSTASQIAGDANCDGLVNSIDALQILRDVAGLPAADCVQGNGDVNCDEAVNSVDALKILRYVAGFPSDTPGCPAIGEQTASSYQLIEQALADGTISDEEATIYRVFAAFGDSRLPDEYRGAPSDLPDSDAAMIAAVKFSGLSAEAQETLQPFLTPPYAEDSWLNLPSVGGAAAAASTETPAPTINPEEWTTFLAADGKVKVWARNGQPDELVKAPLVAKAITDTIWPSLTSLMGEEHAPLSDAGYLNNGGDGALDVYLVTIEDAGQAIPYIKPPPGKPGPCEMTPAYIHVDGGEPLGSATAPGVITATAHEIFHAFQLSFDLYTNCYYPEYKWFMEASAVWAEDHVYPSANSEHKRAAQFLKTPDESLLTQGPMSGYREYAAYLFPFYLTHRFNSPDLIRQIWEGFGAAESLAAIDAALAPQGGFDTLWPEFALYNWNREETSLHHYRDWDGIPDGADTTPIVGTVYSNGSKAEVWYGPGPQEMEYLAARYYYVVDFPSWETEPVRSVIFTNTLFGLPHVNVQALVHIGDDWEDGWQEPRDWTDEDTITFCRDDPATRVADIIVIISNSDWQTKDDLSYPPGSPGPPYFVGSDAPCSRWKGQVTRTGTWGGSVPGDTEVQEKVVARDLVFVRDPSQSTQNEWVYPLESGTVELTVSGWATPCRDGTGSGTTPINGNATVAIGPNNGAGWLKVSKPGVPESQRNYLGYASRADLSLHIVLECGGGGTETYDWNFTMWLDMKDAQPVGDDPSTLAGEYTDPHWGHYQWEFRAAQ